MNLLQDQHAPRRIGPSASGGESWWVYACQFSERLWPIGYCTARCRHPSSGSAEQHYREYVLDQATYDGRWHGVDYQCEVCGSWTNRFAETKEFCTLWG